MRGFPDLRETSGAVAAGGYLIAIFFQVVPHQLHNVFVVFDYQDTFHLFSSRGIAHTIREPSFGSKTLRVRREVFNTTLTPCHSGTVRPGCNIHSAFGPWASCYRSGS